MFFSRRYLAHLALPVHKVTFMNFCKQPFLSSLGPNLQFQIRPYTKLLKLDQTLFLNPGPEGQPEARPPNT